MLEAGGHPRTPAEGPARSLVFRDGARVARDRVCEGASLGQGACAVDLDPGVDLGLDGVDAGEGLLDGIDGREGAVADGGGDFEGGGHGESLTRA